MLLKIDLKVVRFKTLQQNSARGEMWSVKYYYGALIRPPREGIILSFFFFFNFYRSVLSEPFCSGHNRVVGGHAPVDIGNARSGKTCFSKTMRCGEATSFEQLPR